MPTHDARIVDRHWVLGTHPHDRDHIDVKRHQARWALCFRHNTRAAVCLAGPAALPCIEFSAPARCEGRKGQPYEASTAALCHAGPTTSSPASLASPGRPVPSSIMPSRTNLQAGGHPVSTAVQPATVVPCAVPRAAACLVTWDGRGHFTRPGIFYSGRPCLQAEGGWFVKAFLALGGPGDWKSSMPAYLTDGWCRPGCSSLITAYCRCLFFPVRHGHSK